MIVAVIIDSSRPTTASVREYGRMIDNVSQLSGTLGQRKMGSESGSAPMSPTVRISSLSIIATTVSATMQINGDGIDRLTRGKR